MADKGVPRQQRRASERKSSRQRTRRLATGAALAVAAAVGPETAQAATLTVTTLVDNTDTTDNQCSLREAIENANNNDGAHDDCTAGTLGLDTINITPTGTINQSATRFDITDSLTINGPGMALLTIQGGAHSDPIFVADDVNPSNLRDVT